MINAENAKQQIKELLDKYNKVVEEKRISRYNEEMTKKDFILPLFRALGWNVENSDDVTAEERISKKRVDYGFRINGIPKFFLEAKSLKEDLDNPKFVGQAINYAWHKSCTWAVLTDFKNIRIFNAEWKTASPMQSHFKTISCHEFLDRFNELWLLSKESFEEGLLDKEAERWGKKTKKISVDKQLLSDFTRFRDMLSKNITKLNQSKNITEEDLDESVQRVLDRLIFIRNCEDRELEAKTLLPNLREWESKGKGQLIKNIREVFAYFDKEYNSKIFSKHLCDDLDIDNEILHEIIEGLYYTKDKSISYDFSAIEADVLGNIYEQYLGYILKKTEKRAKLTENHAHRKEQGIYYTPTYIVDYIIRNTVCELLKDKRTDVKKLRILDPACGSGSFLIKAFDLLYKQCKDKDEGYSQTKFDSNGKLYTTKTEILQNNIFGVDLDKQAVEIAQLNLLLKIAERGHRLPLLQENIKCGNSLIDDSATAGEKAFKWEKEFKEIVQYNEKGRLKEGYGFDVIVGNPPYINNRNLPENQKAFFEKEYSSAYQQYDIYVLFYELALKLLKPGGYIGFITPNKFAITNYGLPLRKLLLDYKIVKIVDVSQLGVFAEASIYPYIVIVQKLPQVKNKIKIYAPKNSSLEKSSMTEIKQADLKADEPFLFNMNEGGLSLLRKINGEKIIDIYRAKPTSKDINEKGDKTAISNREVERYNLSVTPRRIIGKKEWIIKTPSILMKKICFVPTSTILNNNSMVPINTVYVIRSKNPKIYLQYILGILNSKLIGYYTRKKYATTAMRGGFIELRAFEIENIPIKLISDSEQQSVVKLVNEMLSLNKRLNEIRKRTDERLRIEEEIKKTDAEIDEAVYRIYGITEGERKLIEESI